MKKLPKSLRGRPITEKAIPVVASLKKTLQYLKENNWDSNKLKYNYRKSYECYKIEKVIHILKINEEYNWPQIIRNNILTLYDYEIGTNCIDIYLIAYVCENYGINDWDLVEFLRENHITDSLNTVKNIKQVGKGDGLYLEILNKDGTVKDWTFFDKWVNISNNSNYLFDRVIKEYNDFDLAENKELLFYNMKKEKVNFGDAIDKSIIKQDKKYRWVYCIREKSLEDISLKYIKKRIDREFHIKYPNRHKIMKECFAIINVIGELGDFVIYRYDFKDFFDNVSSKYIYEKYLKKSNLKKYELNILQQLIKGFDKCYPGIVISNSLIEIISNDFDLKVKAYLTKLGLIFYSRYVDDGILIFNKYIKMEEIEVYINKAIQEIFGDSRVTLNAEKTKFISKNQIDNTDFDYLGYKFKKCMDKKNKVYFRYGISEKKLKKYENRMRNIILAYKKDKDIELFRQRIQFMFSRVVYYNNFNSKYSSIGKWDVIGIVANYSELRVFLRDNDKIIEKTKDFLTSSFSNQVENILGKDRPYFLKGKGEEHYNLLSNLEKNKSILFHPTIGWNQEYLNNKIYKLIGMEYGKGKGYRELVKIYSSIIKL